MNYKSFNLGDWIGHISGAIEDYRELDGNEMRDLVEFLTTLKQKPKTERWITQWNGVHQKEYYYCSECREEFSYDGETGIKMNDYDFCPNCGADMRGDKNANND